MDSADKDETSNRPSTKQGGSLMYRSCLVLHALFVVLHLIALIVAILGAEKKVIVNNTHFALVSTAVTVIPQIISTLFLTLILFLTQKLAMIRNLTISQTLTATHDQINAWNGLGKALMTVRTQLAGGSCVSGSIAIVAYLGCITIVHITTPSILSLHPIELNVMGSIPTSLGVPNMSVYIPLTSHSSSNAPQEFWGAVSTFLGVFAANNTDSLSSIGLSGNTLYDVVSINNASMPIVVNATTFNVSCGYIPDWSVNQTSQDNTYPTWDLTNSLVSFANISSYAIAPSSIRVYDNAGGQIPSAALPTINWPFVMLVSTANFTDSSGSLGGLLSLGGPMNPKGNGTWQQIWSLQMIGCTMSLIQSKATVDPSSRLLTSSSPILHKNSSAWRSWSLPENITISDPIEEGLYSMFGSIFFSAASTTYPGGGSPGSVLSAVEQFLALKLNLIPDLGRRFTPAGVRPPPPPVTLHDLENAVAAVSAAAFYSALHITPTALDVTDLLPTSILTQEGESEIIHQVAASQLQLNIPQTVVGLIASIVLMVLAIKLAPDNKANLAVDNLGMLQTMWLLNRHSAVRERVAAVKQPTDRNLRMAGMQEICLAEGDEID